MNLRSLTPQQSDALLKLRMPEFDVIRELLLSQVRESQTVLSRVDDAMTIYRHQGRVAALTDLLQAIEQAPGIFPR